MKGREWCQVALGVVPAAGVMVSLDALVHPIAGMAWIATYYVIYRNYPTMHRLIEKMAGGEEET